MMSVSGKEDRERDGMAWAVKADQTVLVKFQKGSFGMGQEKIKVGQPEMITKKIISWSFN